MHQPPSRSEARSERIPTLVVGIAAFGGLAMSLPFVGLIVRTPWSKCWELLASEASLSALRLSMWTSAVAIVFAVAIGVPVAIVLARYGGRSVAMLRLACTISMVLPPVVGGAALLFALGRRGLIGQWMFRWWGIQLPYSSAAVIIAQIFVALPFVVLTVESSIRSADERLEDAGRALGASPGYVLWRVTLPSVRGGILAGVALGWARAIGEFGATVTFAGSYPGRTQTLPIAIYAAIESDPDAALVLSLLMIAICAVVLIALRSRWFRPVWTIAR